LKRTTITIGDDCWIGAYDKDGPAATVPLSMSFKTCSEKLWANGKSDSKQNLNKAEN
jgi:hypothetical protein